MVHPLTMGLEEHLLHMFRDDFEFNDDAGPSHLGHSARQKGDGNSDRASEQTASPNSMSPAELVWTQAAEQELKKIPFFVRGKARRNTEKYASTQGLAEITMETLYEAKSHFSR